MCPPESSFDLWFEYQDVNRSDLEVNNNALTKRNNIIAKRERWFELIYNNFKER